MTATLERFLGRSPDSLTFAERQRLGGKWIALELYSPKTLPIRKIEAIAGSPGECIRALRQRGLEPKNYEFMMLKL
jgi:hypothetical protein